MTEQEQTYHSALSQCAELLDNMKDGDPLTMTPVFLAAKLMQMKSAGAAREGGITNIKELTRYTVYINCHHPEGHEIVQESDGEYVKFADVADLIAQSSTADKASEVRAADLEREIAQLKERLEKKHKSHFITSQALHNVIVGNQSAWIEWRHGAGAEAAMTWIHNGLAGPGLIPSGKEAQPWFDVNQDDRYDIPPMKEVGAADSDNTGALGEGADRG